MFVAPVPAACFWLAGDQSRAPDGNVRRRGRAALYAPTAPESTVLSYPSARGSEGTVNVAPQQRKAGRRRSPSVGRPAVSRNVAAGVAARVRRLERVRLHADPHDPDAAIVRADASTDRLDCRVSHP